MESDSCEDQFIIEKAGIKHIVFAPLIAQTMTESAKARGTGIAKRTASDIAKCIIDGDALIATSADGRWAGFCYIGHYNDGAFVTASGLIVSPDFRSHGIANALKSRLFNICRTKYPSAVLVGITTNATVMKINSGLGYYPTSFKEMPTDEKFWNGCEMCVNHDILKRTGKKYCLCTAMRFDPPVVQAGSN